MSHTQTITVEVPVTLKVEVELTWNGADSAWESQIVLIEGHKHDIHTCELFDSLEFKMQTSAHDIAVSQLP